MKKRVSKILVLLLLVVISFLGGCVTSGDGNEYSIIYIKDGSVVELEPSTYISGEKTTLPVLEGNFVAWYTNKDFSGKAVTEIKASSVGNLIFYAKFDETVNSYLVIFKNYDDIVLKEETVLENNSATAPNVPTREGYEFTGWSADFSKVTSNMTIYAQYKEVLGENSLSKYIEDSFGNGFNFSLEYKYVEDNQYETVESYKYDGNKVELQYEDMYGDTYTDYINKLEDGTLVYILDNGDGTYEELAEGSADFEEMYGYIFKFSFEDLNDSDFDFANNCFSAKSSKADEIAKAVIGSYEDETYSEFKIYVNNGKVVKISAKSILIYEGETYSFDYEITFSNFGNVTVIIPSVEKEAISISSMTNTYTVVKGATLEEALSNVTIYLNYNDSTKETLENSDSEFSGNYNKDIVGTYAITVKHNDFTCTFNIDVVEEISVKDLETYVNNMNSYTYEYSYNDQYYGEYSSKAFVNNDVFKFEMYDENNNVFYDYLYVNESNTLVYLYDNGDGTYEEYLEGSSSFEENYVYLDLVDILVLKNTDFTYNGTCFVANTSVVDDVAYNLMGAFEGEVYNSLKIYVNDNYITKFTAISSYTYEGSTYTCSYEVNFASINSTNVTLPNGSNVNEKTEVSISVNATNINVVRGTSLDDVLNKITIKLNYSDGTSVTLDKTECEYTHSYSPSTLGSYDVTVKYNDFTCTFKINVLEEVDVFETIDDTVVILEDILDQMGEYEGEVYGVTKGLSDNSKVLVIPVEFTDYKADNQMVEVLEKAFFGTSEETGWESLKSYYYKSSYGKCNITGTVLPVFSTGNSSTYYDNLEDDAAVNSIIKAALEKYDASINYDEYDSDGDKYIDSIYIIYTAPINYESDDSLYWAFSYQYFTDDYEYYDNVEADFYCFMGYDFIFEALANGQKVKYNAETIIHESGHLFGLDDYYDYDDSKGPKGGIGGGDMMDYNVGDHNAFSKLILGWLTPSVIDANNISADITIDLNSFGNTGDCLVICNGWENSYFDEYYVIDFYTPDGLNALEAGFSGLFSTSGIRIYHIDATLNSPSNVGGVWEVYKYNNTDTNHKLIQLVQADGLNEIENDNAYGDNEDLFQVGDSFKNITWYDGSVCNFEIFVNNIGTDNAQITIKFLR